MFFSTGRRAFTLIELLIVVAIIGILAAIAIPNFLEAQTRAKVSRSMADMRSLSLAMQSYQVDNNAYPGFGGATWYGYLMILPGELHWNPGRLLTSPISYISTIPMDVFMSDMIRQTQNAPPGGFGGASVFGSVKQIGESDQNFDGWVSSMHQQRPDLFPARIFWLLESCGPDLSWWQGAGHGAGGDPGSIHRFYYDPTNGSISQGQLAICDQGWISPKK